MLDALDSMKENEVYVCAGASPNYALWGELMSYAARYRGAVGAVMEGYSLTLKAFVKWDFHLLFRILWTGSRGARPRNRLRLPHTILQSG